uniref:Uncharacterized protein LOC114332312 isoform X1 n=1 Tax=Diabrotica virgifera virgifera TaxID=50390 RepID=A0A6P7FNJ3_DIAVI
MELSQVSEKFSKIGTSNHDIDYALLDTMKIEIKEEPLSESAQDAFVYSDLKDLPVKTELEQDEQKFALFEENQVDDKNFLQEENQMQIMEPLTRPSYHKGDYLSRCSEEKRLRKNKKKE